MSTGEDTAKHPLPSGLSRESPASHSGSAIESKYVHPARVLAAHCQAA